MCWRDLYWWCRRDTEIHCTTTGRMRSLLAISAMLCTRHATTLSSCSMAVYVLCGLLQTDTSSHCRELEILSLMVSTLCHDLDHRGTNNSFQVSVVRWMGILASSWYCKGCVISSCRNLPLLLCIVQRDLWWRFVLLMSYRLLASSVYRQPCLQEFLSRHTCWGA